MKISEMTPEQFAHYRERYAGNREKILQRVRNWYTNNSEQAQKRQKEYYSANRERLTEKAREWEKNNLDKKRESNREYRKNHPGKNTEWKRKYNNLHREDVNRRNREYGARHPDERRTRFVNYRAKTIGNGGSHTLKEWRSILDKYSHKCLCCEKSDVKLTRDHVLPVELGGSNSIGNLQPLCQHCNSSKGKRYIDYRPDSYFADWT